MFKQITFKVADIKGRETVGPIDVSRMKQYYPGDEKPAEEPTLYARLEDENVEEQEEDNNTLDAQEVTEDNVTNRSYLHGQPKTQVGLQPVKAADEYNEDMAFEDDDGQDQFDENNLLIAENEHEAQAVTPDEDVFFIEEIKDH